MSFFEDDELDSLAISHMSLHILLAGGECHPRQELPVEHQDFLLDVLKKVAATPLYSFNSSSVTKATIENIASNKLPFAEGAQVLSADFARHHKSHNRSDGAFFVFELLCASPSAKKLYALVKYDYQAALEVQDVDGQTELRKIVEALVNDKKAVQKAAFIRTVGGTAEALISATDRTATAPKITDYFELFLNVSRSRGDDELTEAAKNAVKRALSTLKDRLPGRSSEALSRGFQVFRDAKAITEETIRQAVWVGAGQPEDDETKQLIEKATAASIKYFRLGGIEFNPSRSILGRPIKKRVTTAEGVTIEYGENLVGTAVRESRDGTGNTIFTITTKQYSDEVVSEKSSRSS